MNIYTLFEGYSIPPGFVKKKAGVRFILKVCAGLLLLRQETYIKSYRLFDCSLDIYQTHWQHVIKEGRTLKRECLIDSSAISSSSSPLWLTKYSVAKYLMNNLCLLSSYYVTAAIENLLFTLFSCFPIIRNVRKLLGCCLCLISEIGY